MDFTRFERMYKQFASSPNDKVSLTLILTLEIKRMKDDLIASGMTIELADLEELLNELKIYYNTEKYLSEIRSSMLYFTFSEDTEYFLKFGNKTMCGNFLSLIEDVPTNRKNDHGIFENSISAFGIRVDCQEGKLDIAYGDLKSIEIIK